MDIDEVLLYSIEVSYNNGNLFEYEGTIFVVDITEKDESGNHLQSVINFID